MAIVTTDAVEALLYVYNGYDTVRWNYVDAVGTPVDSPGGIGHGVSLTYSFLAFQPAYSDPAVDVEFGVLDAAMKAATQDVIAHISEIADIDFSEVGAQHGQVTFATSFQTTSSARTYTPFFSPTVDLEGNITAVTEDALSGSVWLNNNRSWIGADWNPGNFGHALLLHEIGHALGLRHPFEADGFAFVLDDSLDNEAHTVMSYTDAPRTLVLTDSGTGVTFSSQSPSTMMMMDIEALQHLYGANANWESGKTVYNWETNEELLETIWDGGGKDTLDCSNQIFRCRIDLRDGEFSSIGMRKTDAQIKQGFDLPSSYSLDPAWRDELYNGQDNLGIAKGAIIENATGGSGNDVITGNDVANRLLGGNGKDKLSGGFGNDILVGGGGTDRLDGGEGADIFVFQAGAGRDIIAGFSHPSDKIALNVAGVDGFKDLVISTNAAGDAVVAWADGTGTAGVTLVGVDASSLRATDFEF